MRHLYLVAYDVCDDKRLRRTYEKMLGHGNSLQYSIFCCELSPVERQRLKEDLWSILDFNEDRVMIVNLGPANDASSEAIEFWGQPRTVKELRVATIV